MSSSLSAQQQRELHESILDYMLNAGFTKTYAQFKEESPDLSTFEPDPRSKTAGLLAKKWTTVVRLQRKLMQTEQRLAEVTEELSQLSHLGSSAKRIDPEWIPRQPAKHTLDGHRDRVTAVAFHPLYSVIASASDDSTVKIWDWEYDTKGIRLVTASYDLSVKLWSVDDGYANIATLVGHEHSVSCARFLPGDDRVVSASRDQTIRIWDLTTKHCVKTIRSHEAWIRCVLPSDDGRTFLSCGDDHIVRLIDAQSGMVKSEMRGHDNVVEAVGIVPRNALSYVKERAGIPASSRTRDDLADISYVASGSRDKTIKIWSAADGGCVATLVGHDDWVRCLVFHPCGKYLLSSSDDKSIKVWELKTGRCVKTIERAHESFVQCIAWGRMKTSGADSEDVPINALASASADKSVKIWTP